MAENFVFWVFLALVGIATWVIMRRVVRRQIATAPKASLRNQTQRWLHWSSLLVCLIPLGYVALVDGSWFWETFAVLAVQSILMVLLRLARIGFEIRLWLLLPVSIASVVVGALISIWPQIDLPSIQSAPWPYLSAVGLAFAISHVLSVWSFPIGYGERAF